MNKIKVMTVFGTRPEAIKMAPLVHALEQNENTESIVCVTAQHREMLDQVLDIFDIKPDYDLNIMQPRQTLATITEKSLHGLDEVLEKAQPDIVLVHGDTSTTFAGALAAFYHKVPVGHVEAGLRTYDKYSPFPEEMNRKLTGQIATLHFAPTPRNRDNLAKEGITDGVFVMGNTVVDAIHMTVKPDFEFRDEQLKTLDFENNRVVLVTAHRRENYGEPMENICRAIAELSEAYPDVHFVYPVHLSPYVRETAEKFLGGNNRIHLIHPLAVDEMHNLMARCYLIMTDSGGLQEEAPSLGKPVLVLRRETERPEAIEAGTVKLAGVEQANIVKLARELFDDKDAYEKWRTLSIRTATERPRSVSCRRSSSILVCARTARLRLTRETRKKREAHTETLSAGHYAEDCGCGRYCARAVGGAQLCAVLRLDARQQHRHYPARQ